MIRLLFPTRGLKSRAFFGSIPEESPVKKDIKRIRILVLPGRTFLKKISVAVTLLLFPFCLEIYNTFGLNINVRTFFVFRVRVLTTGSGTLQHQWAKTSGYVA